jgi:methylmalonyl-CoA epimerase
MKSNLTPIELDHIGIAVHSLDESLRFYVDLIGLELKASETVESERVNVAMLPAGTVVDAPRIELLEPADGESVIARFLEKHGPGLHHIALRVENLREVAKRLEGAGARLLNEPRSGAGGHTYVFVHPSSAGGVLLELIQK